MRIAAATSRWTTQDRPPRLSEFNGRHLLSSCQAGLFDDAGREAGAVCICGACPTHAEGSISRPLARRPDLLNASLRSRGAHRNHGPRSGGQDGARVKSSSIMPYASIHCPPELRAVPLLLGLGREDARARQGIRVERDVALREDRPVSTEAGDCRGKWQRRTFWYATPAPNLRADELSD